MIVPRLISALRAAEQRDDDDPPFERGGFDIAGEIVGGDHVENQVHAPAAGPPRTTSTKSSVV